MQEISRMFGFLGIVFLIITLIINITPHFPRIPGDIYIDKPGIKVYIPITSSVIISIILSLILRSLGK